MAHRRDWTRLYLLACAGIAALALLIAAIALLVRVSRTEQPPTPAPADQRPAPRPEPGTVRAASQGNRFTLRLGQGFRFRDAAVVANRPDDDSDLVFKFVAPQVGGMSTRYNPISQQVETGLEPTLTAPVPLLLAAHIESFETKPNTGATLVPDASSRLCWIP